MKLQFLLFLAFALGTVAFTIPSIESRALESRRAKPCSGNTPRTRQKWCDYDIHTDYTNVVPNTGVTREYHFDIDQITIAPDGVPRFAIAVNGIIPGPTIIANWGDEVVIHVTNNLEAAKNGTSIHWHGIRQKNTNPNDGVTSVTQCPTPPGSTITYKWRAEQYGSTWYHAHIGLQAWEGVHGGIIINGPASANYDVDMGPIILSDWSHKTADELYIFAQTKGPPTLDNGLINGTNVYNSTGSRFVMKVNQGKSYRLRITNAAIDTHWKFMIDNHQLTVIAMDLVPIKPYTTNYIDIGMGQRYDVIVTANQQRAGKDFWMRAIPQTACSENDSVDNIKGIVTYNNHPGTPQTSAYTFTDGCVDEDMGNLVPIVSKSVSPPSFEVVEDASVSFNSDNLFRWYLNSTTLQLDWENPTLQQIYNGVTTFAESDAVITVPNAGEWVYLMINTSIPVAHPIHLHGHDFFVMAQGINPWDGTTNSLVNPPRRDTAMLEGGGYLLIAFEADNPGAWLMHCHIGWHTNEGFALQFVEQEKEARKLIDSQALESNCANWKNYDASSDVVQDDSGI